MAKAGQPVLDRVGRIRRMLEDGTPDEDLFSRNLVTRTPWGIAAARGKISSKKTKTTRRIFSDAQVAVLDAIEEGNKVAVQWRMRGKWTQPVAGLKPTGAEMEITGMTIYRFVGDKIVEVNGEVDMGTFAQQAIGGGIRAEECAQALQQLGRPPDVILKGVGPGV